MEKLKNYIIDYFKTKSEYFKIFDKNDVRVEGWFKGELLMLLTSLKNESIISGFDREVKIYYSEKRYQIDFQINNGYEEYLIELKALAIGQKRNTPRNLQFYFNHNKLGLINDFDKLKKINYKDEDKWVIAFIYPKPDKKEWEKLINENKIKVITDIDKFDDNFFIAIMRSK